MSDAKLRFGAAPVACGVAALPLSLVSFLLSAALAMEPRSGVRVYYLAGVCATALVLAALGVATFLRARKVVRGTSGRVRIATLGFASITTATFAVLLAIAVHTTTEVAPFLPDFLPMP